MKIVSPQKNVSPLRSVGEESLHADSGCFPGSAVGFKQILTHRETQAQTSVLIVTHLLISTGSPGYPAPSGAAPAPAALTDALRSSNNCPNALNLVARWW